jgi:hypothetical protein
VCYDDGMKTHASPNVRTHVMLPRELLADFDRLVGDRKRSEAVAELIAEWVKHEKRKEVFTRLAGFVKDEDHPEWKTPEDEYNWVRQLRGEYHVPGPEAEWPR